MESSLEKSSTKKRKEWDDSFPKNQNKKARLETCIEVIDNFPSEEEIQTTIHDKKWITNWEEFFKKTLKLKSSTTLKKDPIEVSMKEKVKAFLQSDQYKTCKKKLRKVKMKSRTYRFVCQELTAYKRHVQGYQDQMKSIQAKIDEKSREIERLEDDKKELEYKIQ